MPQNRATLMVPMFTKQLFSKRVRITAMALAALSLTACKKPEASGPTIEATDDTKPIKVSTVTATARSVPQSMQTTGSLFADQQSELTPVVQGRVVEVLVERGNKVKANDPIMRLRDVDYRTAIDSAEAMLSQARARLGGSGNPAAAPEVRAAAANRDQAEDQLQRMEQLAQSGAVSDADLQRARAGARAAREQYNAALNGVRAAMQGLRVSQVSLDSSRRNLDETTVRAPFDGEIAERRANVGEFATPQRSIALLVKTNPLRLELLVPQEKIALVKAGQKVDIRTEAYPNEVFLGTVKYLSPVVRTDTRAMVVEATVPNDAEKLHPGMFVTGRVQLEQSINAVVVPATSVLTDAGVSRLFVVNNNVAEERVVTVLDRNEKEVVISRGLSANERVADGESIALLFDGARVE